MHTCPAFTGPVPHVGGPIIGPGAPTVLIGKLPAARVTDQCTCVGPPDAIIKGSATVITSKLPQARIGDSCAHGGAIVLGCFTVIVGG
ncbi:MAG: PAAR domain-containing protein [Sphingomonas fennica]